MIDVVSIEQALAALPVRKSRRWLAALTVELCGRSFVLDPGDPEFPRKLDTLTAQIRAWALLRRAHHEEIADALRLLNQQKS